jgi:hypothetical protein
MSELKYKTHPHNDYPYWLFDPCWEGMMFFRTEADRDAAAEEAIAGHLDEHWSEEIEHVCCGVVTHFAQCLDKTERPEDLDEENCDGEGSYWPDDMGWRGNYKMEPLTPNAGIHRAAEGRPVE